MCLSEWPLLSDNEIRAGDIGAFDLAAAEGLPGAEGLDRAACLAVLDSWSNAVAAKTARSLHRRAHEFPDLTENQFRILVLVTVMQRDLGVQYNLAFSEGEYDARDSRHLFLHGLLTGCGGTCVTLPALYVALGRRLGYPLTLAAAREHFYCRWSDDEPFCIEATAPGFTVHDDEHFRTYPRPLSDADLRSGVYLRDYTPREELAHFLYDRGVCQRENLRLREACRWFAQAAAMCPHIVQLRNERLVAEQMSWMIEDEDLLDLLFTERAMRDALGDRWTVPRPQRPRSHEIAAEHLYRILGNHARGPAKMARYGSFS